MPTSESVRGTLDGCETTSVPVRYVGEIKENLRHGMLLLAVEMNG